jgi:outer membrane protein
MKIYSIYKPLANLRVIFRLVLAIFLVPVAVTAQDQKPGEIMELSLQQAIDYTLSHQSAIQNAQLDQKIAKQKINEITGVGLPQINGSFELQDFVIRPTSIFPDFITPATYGVLLKEGLIPPSHFPTQIGSFPVQFGTKYQASGGVSVSQLIFDGGFFVGLKAAKVYSQLAQKTTDRSRIEAVEAITKAYYGVVINNEHRKLLTANISRLQKIYEDTKAYNESGFAEKIDVDRLKVQLNNLNVESEKVDKFLEVSVNLLKFQMGMLVNTNVKLTDTLTYTQLSGSAPNTEYNNRIEFSLLQTAKELYSLDVKRNQAGYLPSLVAYGNLSTQALRNQFDFGSSNQRWFATEILGAKLTVPIFDGLQKNARIQQAKLTLQKTKNDENNLKNLIDFQVQSAKITYENSYKTVEEQKQNMELAQEVARVTQIKYKEGVGSNLEVVTAETSLRESQTNYFDALYSLIIARTDFLKAQGTLSK